MQTADGIDTSANTRIIPNPVGEVRQDGSHANDSINEDLLTRIPALPDGDVRIAASEHIARRTSSARAGATVSRKFVKEYPDITMNTKLTPGIVDVFKAITGLLTWRTTNNPLLQLVRRRYNR